MSWCWRVALRTPLLAVLCVACGAGGTEVPPGVVAADTRVVHVDLGVLVKPVRALAGLDGDPLFYPGEQRPDVAEMYRTRGVKHVRLSHGSRCRLTLDALFPHPNFGANDLGTPVFDQLDRAVRTLIEKGMVPVLGAMYDIGEGGCIAHKDLEAGKGISDPDLFAAAVVQVIKHLQKKGLTPPLVEFYPDPFGSGGFKVAGFSQYYNAWTRLNKAISEAFPVIPRAFRLVAPAIPVSGQAELSDPSHPFNKFATSVAAAPHDAPDVFAITSVAALPEDHLAIVVGAASLLKDLGLTNSAVADFGVRVRPDLWTLLGSVLPTREDRSAFLAAHLIATRILLQGHVEVFSADRWGGPTGPDGVPEDLFLREDGSSLPALEAMLAMYVIEAAGAIRVEAALEGGGASDGHGVAVMAARRDDEVFLLAAAADPGKVGSSLRVRFEVTGFPSALTEAKVLRNTLTAAAQAFVWQEASTVNLVDGKLLIERTIPVPSVLVIDVTPVVPSVSEDVRDGSQE